MLISIILFLSLAYKFVYPYIASDPLPIDFAQVDKIVMHEIKYVADKNDKYKKHEREFVIKKPAEIKAINEILKKAKGGRMDTPSCPFGLPVTFWLGKNKVEVEMGTDDCGLVSCNGLYYYLPDGELQKFETIVKKLGIDYEDIRF